MPKFSTISNRKLAECHYDLQTLMREVVKHFDCTIVYGHRSVQLQQELYAKGRTAPGNIVTYADGVKKKSKHNVFPSLAVDAVPYPIDWNDSERLAYFAGFVMATAIRLKEEGKISKNIRWGGDWDGDKELKDQRLVDFPHFEIVD